MVPMGERCLRAAPAAALPAAHAAASPPGWPAGRAAECHEQEALLMNRYKNCCNVYCFVLAPVIGTLLTAHETQEWAGPRVAAWGAATDSVPQGPTLSVAAPQAATRGPAQRRRRSGLVKKRYGAAAWLIYMGAWPWRLSRLHAFCSVGTGPRAALRCVRWGDGRTAGAGGRGQERAAPGGAKVQCGALGGGRNRAGPMRGMGLSGYDPWLAGGGRAWRFPRARQCWEVGRASDVVDSAVTCEAGAGVGA
jgi:hypothetical protein